ncbi:MAG: SH3 domain-containing protein [Sphingomonas bacterium]|nr:SH3 domain-containing protein [Sphingomonas bacterium]
MSSHPDPATHAYRKDLADTALAGRVIASHYADPLIRHIARDTDLRSMPSDEGEILAALALGDAFRMLDSSRGWAWGYAPDGRVGYVSADAVSR